MEDIERFDDPKKADIDGAEARLRALERAPNVNSTNKPDQVASAQSQTVDTSQTWWNKRNEQSRPSYWDKAKEIAVAGTAGAILVGGALFAGQEALEQQVAMDHPGDDVTQAQIIQKPDIWQEKFVVSEQPYTRVVEQVQQTTSTAEATVSAQVEKTDSGWWHSVPEYSQHGLNYKGGKTEYGCVPASTSMVLEYWHQKDPANPTISAQELLDNNVTQGEFDRYGMSSSNIDDDVSKLGYKAQDHTNASLDELKSAVADGPVVAVVKLGMKPDGTNHAVVVTGISEQNEVLVNDPWTGRADTYSWDQFSKSWGANFGKDAPTNSFTTIRPK